MDYNQFVISIFCAILFAGEVSCNDEATIDEEKTKLREKMIGLLKKMSNESRSFESDMAILKLLHLPAFRTRRRIGVYLHTELEPRTDKLIANIFSSGKRCFIPRRNGTSMDLVILRSMEEYSNLKVNELGFKEPSSDESRENALSDGGLDVLIMPGLAFTLEGDRLGRGTRMYENYVASLRPGQRPALIGLAFEIQILKEIPMDQNDIKVGTVMRTKYLDNNSFG